MPATVAPPGRERAQHVHGGGDGLRRPGHPLAPDLEPRVRGPGAQRDALIGEPDEVLRAIVRVAPFGQDEPARAHAIAIERVVLDLEARGLGLAPRVLDPALEIELLLGGTHGGGRAGGERGDRVDVGGVTRLELQ